MNGGFLVPFPQMQRLAALILKECLKRFKTAQMSSVDLCTQSGQTTNLRQTHPFFSGVSFCRRDSDWRSQSFYFRFAMVVRFDGFVVFHLCKIQ